MMDWKCFSVSASIALQFGWGDWAMSDVEAANANRRTRGFRMRTFYSASRAQSLFAPARGPEAVRSGGSEFRREEPRECVQVRGIRSEATGRLLAGNIGGRIE